MNKKRQYLILLHLVIIVWGFTGIMGRAIDLSSSVLVWYRMLFAFISLGCMIRLFKRPQTQIDRKTLYTIMAVGVVVGLHWFTFFQSIKMSSVSLGIICLSTASTHVAWLVPLMEKKRLKPLEFVFGALCIFGIFFIVKNQSVNLPALAVGLFSAFLAALFSTSNSILVKKVPSAQLTFIELISGFVVISIILFAEGNLNLALFHLSTMNFLNLLFLGIVCTSIAFIIAVDATKYLGAFTVSLSINLEPVYTIIMALLIYPETETMQPTFYVGASIILLAVFANAWVQYRGNKRNQEVVTREL